MDRRAYLAVVAGSLVTASGCLSQADRPGDTVTTDESPDLPAGDWPQYQVDAANTGFHAAASGPTEQPVDRWDSTGSDAGPAGSPAIVDGTVYAASSAGGIAAYGEQDGGERWRSNQPKETHSTPAVVDGTVYACTRNAVYAFDADNGDTNWEFDLGRARKNASPTSPTIHDGTLYVGGFDQRVHAIDTDTGEKEWQFHAGDQPSIPSAAAGAIFVTNARGDVFAVDATDGTERWTYSPTSNGQDLGFHTSPTVAGDTVYVGVDASDQDVTHSGNGIVYALDLRDGSKEWETETTWPVWGLATDGEFVFVGTSSPGHIGEGAMVALSAADGANSWRTEVGGRVRSDPAVTNDTIYIGSWSPEPDDPNRVRALARSDGTKRWSLTGLESTSQSPVAVNDTLYLVTDGTLSALEQP